MNSFREYASADFYVLILSKETCGNVNTKSYESRMAKTRYEGKENERSIQINNTCSVQDWTLGQ